MKKSSRLIINVLVLILLLLNPLSSFAATAVEAQSIGSEKSLATVDVTANIRWQGGPEQKPTLWLLLNREIDGSVEEVPGILPKEVSSVTGPVTWYGLPKYASNGSEIDYRVSQGIWDAVRQRFTEIEPEGYQAFSSSNGLTITNIYIEREIILPVETDEPVLEPVVEETEPPASTPEPPEDLTEPVEQPEEPIELEHPIEAPVEPIEVPVELEDPIEPPALETPEPIELPIEVTKPPALETPDPVEPPVITPEPTPPAEETPLPKSITVSISWQGGETPRPAFWLKLQEVDPEGNKSDVEGTEAIQANFATQITWANVESYNADASYTVAIVDQNGQATSIPGYTSHIDGLSLTNIWQEQSANDVIAKVEWLYSLEPKEAINWSEIEGFEIPSIWLRLYRQSGEHEVPVALLSTELKELSNGATTAVWADMPKTNAAGVEYIYSVKQVDANGADFSHELFNKVENGLVVKNVAKDGNGLKGIFDPVATHTYNFKVDGATVDTQIVKNGELLTEPTVPVKEGQKITGWYVNGAKIDFTQPVTVSGTATVEAIAQFAPVLYVFFMDGVGANARVIVTKEGIAGGTVSTTDVKPNLGSTQGVTGWYRDQALTDGPVGDSFTIGTTNQVLWPKIESGNYLYFESGDNATYIEPQFVPAGQNTVAPTNPTRPGYTFGHWSATPGGAMYGFGQPITSSVTLHAVWQATSTSYTVVYWKQSVNDNKNAADADKTYDFAHLSSRTALTGTSVSPTTGDGTMPFANFHYNAAKETTAVVKGDGTTVLNVYYDRNLLTIDFKNRTYPYSIIQTMTGLYGQTLAQNGYTWPSDSRWTRTTNGSGILTFLDAFIFDNLLEYGSATHITLYQQRNTGSARITHYKETLAGGWQSANTNTTGGGSFSFTNKYTGFVVSEYSADGGEWLPAVIGQSASYSSTLDIRHTRNSYTLSFYNYNGYAKYEQFKYEAPLAGQASYVPPRPSGIDEVFVFQGWYKDTAMTEPFNFATETMPANNLAIYAKWAPPVLSGTAHENPEGTSGPVSFPVTYNQPIDRSTIPTVKDSLGNVVFQGDDSKTITMPANHKWIGWSTRDGSDYTTFNFNTRILSDITLYPYWVNNEKFNVTYAANGGSGTVPTDGQNYAYGSYADVAALGTLTPPSGQVFLGWLHDGVLYQPGDKIRITGNMTLTPSWGPMAPTTTITYQSNYPEGAQAADYVVGPLPNNGSHTLVQPGTAGFTAPTGYRFLHWQYTNRQGGTETGDPGDEVMVDITPNANNIVKAIWMKIIDVEATKVWSGGPTPRPDVQFQLYRNIEGGTPVLVPGADTKTLSNGTTTATWTGMDQTDDNGNLYIYTVREVAAPANYTKSESGLTVTNTYTQPETEEDVIGTKVWVNGPKPAVEFELWRKNGTAGAGEKVVDATAVDGTTNTVNFGKQLKTDINGVEYEYYVVEPVTPDNYTKVENGLTVTNTYTQPETEDDVIGTKVWVNGPKPAVAFELWRKNGTAGAGEKVVDATAVDGTTNTVNFGKPLKTDINGVEYEYYVVEPVTPENYTKSESGLTVTNTYVPPVSEDDLVATKVWVNGPEPRPAVEFELWRKNGTAGEGEKVAGPTAVDPVTLKVNFGPQPLTDINGVEYEYYVLEPVTPENYSKVESGMTVTNTYVPPVSEDDLVATKVWVNGPEPRPAVEFELWRKNGTAGEGEKVAGPTAVDPVTLKVNFGPQPLTDINGVEYEYYVLEPVTPENYSKVESGMTVTNTYVPPVSEDDLVATKVWVNGPEPRPAVEFELWRMNGTAGEGEKVAGPTAVDPVTLKVNFGPQPLTDINGVEYEYYVLEPVTPENYSKVESGMTVTNTYVQPTGDLVGIKKWMPAKLKDSLKVPVKFQLMRSYTIPGEIYPIEEEVGEPVDVTAPDWNYTWEDMPTHNINGYEYTYWVVEVVTPENFKKAEEGMTVTNTYVSPTEDLVGTKVWMPEGLLDSMKFPVTYQLYRYTTDPDTPEMVGEPVELNAPDWAYTWTGMPTTDAVGNPYTYYVVETSELEDGFSKVEDGLNVTNTYDNEDDDVIADVTATKTWMPEGLLDSMKFPVTYQLYRYTTDPDTPEMVGEPVELNAPDWAYTWTGMPTTDAVGNPYTYYVVETSELEDGFSKVEDGLNVTNTYDNMDDDVIADVTATKTWMPEGLLDSMKFPVTYQLYRYTTDPDTPEMVGEPVELNAPDWAYTWTGMPTTDAVGNPYTYYVVETSELEDGFSKVEDGLNVTNTYDNEDDDVIADVTATKTWMPEGLLDSMKFPVTYQLYRYTTDPDTPEMVGEPVELNAPDWAYTWTGMPTTDTVGNPYTYYVVETSELEDGFSKVEDGLNVTNTYDNEDDDVIADVTATKTWMPEGLLDSMKFPVTYQLYRYTTDPDTPEMVGEPVELNAPDWAYTWTGMPTTDAVGNPYTYYVVETSELEDGFSKVEDGLNVTNTYDNEDDDVIADVTATKTWMPEGLLDSMKFPVTYQLYRYTTDPDTPEMVGDPVELNAPDWAYTWTGMPTTDAVGNPYTYYVVETSELEDGFSKVEDGLNVTNTYDNMDDDVIADVTATKTWMPEGLLDELKVPVSFQLWRHIGDPEAAEKVGDPVVLNADGGWEYIWKGMPKTDEVGNPYTYFLEELETPEGFEKLEEGMFVTNTYVIPNDAITAEKVWVGGKAPRPTVWFQLWRTWTRAGTTHHEIVPGAEIKALPDGTLTVFWTDIEAETIIGIPYTFYVKEVDEDGNDFTPENYTKLEAGLKVTNVYVPPTMVDPLYMNKIWQGGQAPYPAIYLQLYRNIPGGTSEAVGAPIMLDGVADGGCVSACEIEPWRAIFRDLPLTDNDGNTYTYTMKETDASGNDFTPEGYVRSYDGYTVTNTYVSAKIDVTATKVWKGGSGTRPTIRLQLYRNGEAYGNPVDLVHPNTTYTWKDLDKTDQNAIAYTYTVDEVDIPANYSKSVVGLTITNTYIGGTKPPEVPYTGDASNALLYGVLALSSLAGFGAVTVAKRRKKK